MPLLVTAVVTTMRAAVYARLPVQSPAELVLGVGRVDRGGLVVTIINAVNAITPMMAAQLPLADL